MLRVLAVVDDDVTRQVHDGDHHGHRGKAGEERRDHAGTTDDLGERCGRLGRALGLRRHQLADALRVGPNVEREDEGDEREHARTEPRNGQDACVELVLAREDRAEDGRAEDRAHNSTAQHVGDPSRTAVGRVHVAGRRPDQQRHAAGCADEREAGDHRDGGLGRRPERGQRAAGGAEHEADRDDRDTPEAIHGPPGREGGEGRGGEEDRRP
ncbi:MAG TPA: hypothetical protein VF236_10475 [Gaiellaceae bacterium]